MKKKIAQILAASIFKLEMSGVTVEIPLADFPPEAVEKFRKIAMREGITVDEVIRRLSMAGVEEVLASREKLPELAR